MNSPLLDGNTAAELANDLKNCSYDELRQANMDKILEKAKGMAFENDVYDISEDFTEILTGQYFEDSVYESIAQKLAKIDNASPDNKPYRQMQLGRLMERLWMDKLVSLWIDKAEQEVMEELMG